MKSSKYLLVMLAGMLLSSVCWAGEEGAVIYRNKCASCHGAKGQGGKAGPVLMGTSLGRQQVLDLLTKGEAGKKPPHGKPIQGLNPDHAKSAVEFVKSLR
jgi:mono/diheme cytochrome c family protein